MKIQLDFAEKSIKLEDNVNLGEFTKKIKKLIPDWADWTLTTNTIIHNWTNPIVIDPVYPGPDQYPWQPFYTGGPGVAITTTPDINTTYCIDMQ
jgi:hypothetical protein